MLLRYVDACLKEEKRKEEGAEGIGGGRDFWTEERMARKARMEGGRGGGVGNGLEGGTDGCMNRCMGGEGRMDGGGI